MVRNAVTASRAAASPMAGRRPRPGRLETALLRVVSRPNHLAGSALFGVLLAVFGMAVLFPVFFVAYVVTGYRPHAATRSTAPVLVDLVGSVAFAPVVETLLLVALYEGGRRWLRLSRSGFVIAGFVMGGLAHSYRGLGASVAAVFFAVLSFEYSCLRDRDGASPAFTGTAMTHAANNMVAFVVIQLAQTS